MYIKAVVAQFEECRSKFHKVLGSNLVNSNRCVTGSHAHLVDGIENQVHKSKTW